MLRGLGMSGNLPNCIIVGVAKCGTSALHGYLDLHPEVSMSNPKELSYFSEARGWHNGLEWYKSHWPTRNNVMGESSPSYTYDPDWQEVPQRIKTIIPGAKLLYIARDPIDRILSHYQNLYRKRQEFRSLEEALTTPSIADTVYVKDTRYYTHVSHYLRFFDEAQFHVVILEELQCNPRQVMREVFSYLDVDSSFHTEAFTRTVNKTAPKNRETDLGYALRTVRRTSILSGLPVPQFASRWYKTWLKKPVSRPVLTAELEAGLKEALQGEMELFRKLTGKPLECWKI